MTLRDEIAEALCRSFYGTAWDRTSDFRHDVCRQMADALLPIVERVAREVLHDAITAATFDGLGSVDADAIVRRVMEGGQ